MSSGPVKLGIIGLGRWARVLTRAAKKSDKLEIVAGFNRSAEKRESYHRDTGIAVYDDLKVMLADPSIEGVILTVPNEQHLPVAAEVAAAGKHVYTEKPIASTLEEGLQIAALERQHGVTVTVGHSARLLAGIRQIRAAIDSGELGTVGFIEANFSNERALELTPQTWRWYNHRAPGGPLSQLGIHMFDLVHYLGGDIVSASSTSSKLSPVGAEVDDQSMTLLKFADGKIASVGTCWTSPGIFAVRVFGSKGLRGLVIGWLQGRTFCPLSEQDRSLKRPRQGLSERIGSLSWLAPRPLASDREQVRERCVGEALDPGARLDRSGQPRLDLLRPALLLDHAGVPVE